MRPCFPSVGCGKVSEVSKLLPLCSFPGRKGCLVSRSGGLGDFRDFEAIKCTEDLRQGVGNGAVPGLVKRDQPFGSPSSYGAQACPECLSKRSVAVD
jgi:hypothetical protein